MERLKVNAEELKHKIKKILGEDLTFNKDFESYAGLIKNLEPNLLEWCYRLKNKEVKFEPSPSTPDCILFIKKLGSSNRCIVVKIVNGEFKEFHLSDHKYYDSLRKKFGIKKDSYVY